MIIILLLWLTEAEHVAILRVEHKARQEVRLWDGTRVDMLNDKYAYEVDWAPKWAEAIGQSLYYSKITKRKPAIVLLVKDTTDFKYVYRCQVVCVAEDITLFVKKIKGGD